MYRIVLFLLLLAVPVYGANPSWVEHALRLSGESEEVATRAIRRLRATPKLHQELVKGLQKEAFFYLALDVIATLRIRRFRQYLAEHYWDDETGAVYLTLNRLVNTPEEWVKLANLYHLRLFSLPVPVASKLVMIDTLARLKAPLENRELVTLLESKNFELRSGGLSYLRKMILEADRRDWVTLLQPLFTDVAYQIRAQAWCLASELSVEDRAKLTFPKCEREPMEEVRALCLKK